jgi:hypothetical protein
MRWLRRITVAVLVAGIPAANAAPLVPPGDQPGRERYRFTPSPLDALGLWPSQRLAIAAIPARSELLKSVR